MPIRSVSVARASVGPARKKYRALPIGLIGIRRPICARRKPSLPARMLGGIRNPLGAKAIYLGNTLYRIHGTNEPKSIGKAESSGCFRMLNANVLHLATLVHVGTEVTIVRSLDGKVASAAKTPKPKSERSSQSRLRGSTLLGRRWRGLALTLRAFGRRGSSRQPMQVIAMRDPGICSRRRRIRPRAGTGSRGRRPG